MPSFLSVGAYNGWAESKGQALEPAVPIISPVGFILSLEVASDFLEYQLFSLDCKKALCLFFCLAPACGITTCAQDMLGECFLRLPEF